MRRFAPSLITVGLLVFTAGCGTGPAPVAAPFTAANPQVSQQALFAKGVQKIVSDAFVAYDHNRNGVIELERPTGGSFWTRVGNFLFWRDERVRSVTNTYGASDQLTVATRVYTQFPLFFAADADHDQRVTMAELQALVSTYDADHDGQLDARGIRFWRDKNELERFNADFGERLMTYREVDLAVDATRTGTVSVNAASR